MNIKKLFRTSVFGLLIIVLAMANSGCYYRYGYYGPRYGYTHRVYVAPPPRVYYNRAPHHYNHHRSRNEYYRSNSHHYRNEGSNYRGNYNRRSHSQNSGTRRR